MMLCDTMQERDMQKQLKNRKKDVDRQIELQWEELEQQKMNEHDEKLRLKLIAEYELKVKNSHIVKEQLIDFKMKYLKKY